MMIVGAGFTVTFSGARSPALKAFCAACAAATPAPGDRDAAGNGSR